MRQVKFLKYVRPDEAYKWWNSKELRKICINADEVQYVDKKTSLYYDVKGYLANEPVTVIHMRNGDAIDVKGEYQTVLDKIRGDSEK